MELQPAPKPKAAPKTAAKRGRKPGTGGREYGVERITDSRLDKKKGTIEYLVKWQGYRVADNTWEPAANLTHCAKKLAEYKKSQKAK